MIFGEPLLLLLTLLGPALLWLARGSVEDVKRIPSIVLVPGGVDTARASRRLPPPWAWAAAAACILAGIAAAGPRVQPTSVSIVLDLTPAMRRVDGARVSRFDRARNALRGALADLPSDANIHLTCVPGVSARGTPAAIERILEGLVPSEDLTLESFAALSRTGMGELWTLTSAVKIDGSARAWRFGADSENAGWLAAYRSGDRVHGVVANGGTRRRILTVAHGASSLRAEIAPQDAKVVDFPAASGAGALSLTPDDGIPDALELDNRIAVASTGLGVRAVAGTPEPLRRALEAFAKARGPSSPEAPRAVAHPLGTPNAIDTAGTTLAFEYAPPEKQGFSTRPVRASAAVLISSLTLPAEIRATTVEVAEPWIVDARNGVPLAGLDARKARLGLDMTDPALANSPVLPVLIAAMADELLRRAGIGVSRDPRWTLDAGSTLEKFEFSSAHAGSGGEARNLPYFAWAAAVCALGAGLLVFTRS